MKRSKSQYRRLIELDRRIRDNKYPNCRSFAREWGVQPKTIQRDIDYMRDQLEAPIEYDPVRHGYFYAGRTWFMPALNMSSGELAALFMSVQMFRQFRGTPMMKSLESVAGKIQELLGDEVEVEPEMLFANFTVMAPASRPVRPEVWAPVLAGLRDRCTIRIRYTHFDADAAKEWDFNPWHLANLQGEWYLFGAPADKPGQVIQVAMAKIEWARPTGANFVPDPGFNMQEILSTTFGRAALGDEPRLVRLLFAPGAGELARQYAWNSSHKFEQTADGRVEMSFRAVGMYEVLRWVLAWGGDVEVLEPASLRQEVLAAAGKIMATYGGNSALVDSGSPPG